MAPLKRAHPLGRTLSSTVEIVYTGFRVIFVFLFPVSPAITNVVSSIMPSFMRDYTHQSVLCCVILFIFDSLLILSPLNFLSVYRYGNILLKGNFTPVPSRPVTSLVYTPY